MKTMPFIQPNDSPGYKALNFSPRFWLLVVITGIGAGLGASLLMALLAVVQHWSYSYSSGDLPPIGPRPGYRCGDRCCDTRELPASGNDAGPGAAPIGS